MTDFSKATDDVKYPLGDDGRRATAFVWFTINKEILYGGFNPSFNYVLPKPTDNDISLPKYVRGAGVKSGNRKPIVPAADPEDGFLEETPASAQNQGSGGATIADSSAAKEEEKARESKEVIEKDIKAVRDIVKNKGINLAYYKKKKKVLVDFIAEYELAPEKYNGYEDVYIGAKKRLGM